MVDVSIILQSGSANHRCGVRPRPATVSASPARQSQGSPSRCLNRRGPLSRPPPSKRDGKDAPPCAGAQRASTPRIGQLRRRIATAGLWRAARPLVVASGAFRPGADDAHVLALGLTGRTLMARPLLVSALLARGTELSCLIGNTRPDAELGESHLSDSESIPRLPTLQSTKSRSEGSALQARF
jgi:hypothetical protein